MYPAIFLDRDGVIIENRPKHVRTWNDVEIFPQALDALARIAESPTKIIIVTNQSCIGRGLIHPDVADEINQRLVRKIKRAGGRMDGVYMCPHKPSDLCNCRKPRPGLLLEAAQAHSIDLTKSFMIGDSLSDLQAGRSAGVKQVALVRTGRGAQEEMSPKAAQISPFPVFESLSRALDHLLKTWSFTAMDRYSAQ